MNNMLRLPALEGYVVIESETVSVVNDEGDTVQVSIEEWEFMRKDLRFDDAVDYARGETPMTNYQFRSFVDLIRKMKRLEAEHERLLTERAEKLNNT